MFRFAAPPLAAALIMAGCGYVGEPLPPLANVPARVNDLAAMQRASRIVVQFTVPPLTTEGRPIKDPVKFDLRIGAAGVPFQADEWAAHARAVTEISSGSGLAHYEIPAAEWIDKEAIVAVRVLGSNGKSAGWSNFVTVPVMAPPGQPAGLTATATAEGVRLTWQAGGGNFKVFRKTEGENFVLAATVQQPQWIDGGAEFGKPYTYQVQSIVKLGDNREAESDPSAEVSITPIDKFPPAAPSGLRASAAPNSVELSWDRNSEPDLAGYRVYRAVAAGPFEKLADPGQIPSYSDHNVERGKAYRYAVSAFDRAGNESAKSAPAEVPLP